MRTSIKTLLCLALAASVLLAEASNAGGVDSSTIVSAAQKAAVAAVNFREGDAAGFNKARTDFTEEGWKDFLRHMVGFLDSQGAPTFNSSFVPSKSAKILDENEGKIHFRIPGTLTQSNQQGRTTYAHAALEVHVIYDPVKKQGDIQRLEQITCAGASTACD